MKRIMGLLVASFVLGVMAIMPGGAGAQEPSSVKVMAFICPQEYDGTMWEVDCDPLPDVEVSVYLDASEYGFTEMTDANGDSFFEIEGDGPFVVQLGVPGDFAEFMSYCGVVGVPEPMQVEGANTNRMIVPLGSGLNVECAFYVMPVDARGEVSDPQTPEDIEVLPSTGSGVIENHSGATTVVLLISAVVLLAGLGMLTTREDLFEGR